ncbi:hypothetical protein B0H65DRAFT_479020 [Neurospora tetraspora]|uniref:DUF7896 domain-containing protein n=1 Tax=Neurospora tetraspora TaxID=94610 RepID=A0AAE0J7N6_9PEZI|nr:hypothetical protein B0H65DRAFT_479020 [Neurospora tetraspora]
MDLVVAEVEDKSELTRLQCPQCDRRPDGFNSVKDLGSHMVGVHRRKIKWVCSVLAHCRNCSSKKQYGAYHDVVAHLRRNLSLRVKQPRKGPKQKQENEATEAGEHLLAQFIGFEYVDGAEHSGMTGTGIQGL